MIHSKMMMIILVIVPAFVAGSAAFATEYAVVTNSTNEYTADEVILHQQVKRLFLKQQQDWPSGKNARTFDRKKGSAAQKAFATVVLGMTESQLAQYWLKLKQTSGETPPREVDSIRILAKLMIKNKGSLSVMTSEEVSITTGLVNVLFTFNSE